MKAYTDLNQSKKLAEILPLESADMYWKNGISDKYIQCFTPFVSDDDRSNVDFEYDVPCWSLAALIELMPKSICIKQSEHSGYFYFLEWQFANDNSLRYVGHDGKCIIDIYSDHDVKWKDSIDTAFEMVCWLKENGKI